MAMCGKNSQKISAVIWYVSVYVAIRQKDSTQRNGSNIACFKSTKEQKLLFNELKVGYPPKVTMAAVSLEQGCRRRMEVYE